jgi:hypothetical protein
VHSQIFVEEEGFSVENTIVDPILSEDMETAKALRSIQRNFKYFRKIEVKLPLETILHRCNVTISPK